MNNPLVSIIIPVYNGSNYLRDAIDSALAQMYQNCEIIVVNDGSTDNTEEIGLSYGDKIRYFKKNNGGVSTALNLGIKEMRGEYFSWLSHDDIYYPNKIEKQIEALRKNGDMKKIVLGDYDILNQDTGKHSLIILKNVADENSITNSVFPVIQSLIAGCVLLIHRSHFERVGKFNPQMHYIQDYDLWFRILRGQKSLYINNSLMSVREHSKQDTKVKATLMHKEETMLWKGYVNTLSDDEMSEIYKSKFLFMFEMNERIQRHDVADKEVHTRLTEEKNLKQIEQKLKKELAEFCGDRTLEISIFGVGYQGLRIYRMLRFCGIDINCFIDNNPQKHNTTIIDGIICNSFDNMSASKHFTLVVVAILDNSIVLKQLINAEFQFIITLSQLEKIMEKMK
jgi:glycosyltransferase involved in cell wall biosynthesis